MAVTSPILRAMQRRTAMVAVGASTVRGVGGTGTAAAARGHLATLDLNRFVVPTERRFRNILDRETLALARALPRGSRHWGLARKLLNIFLRDALYNQYLCQFYRLETIEHWLEIPLDSHVGKSLREELQTELVPPWGTIKALSPELSARFQAAARVAATSKGIAPVHLDLFYWRGHD